MCYICGMMKVTVTRNIRISPIVLDRIKVLAQKRKWSMNGWIANTLERESRPRDKGGEANDKATRTIEALGRLKSRATSGDGK